MTYQHNYTNVAQSKRLIDAGLPAETADCCLERVEGTESDRMVTVTEWEENYDFYKEEDMFPCWSLGRLVELATKMLEHVWEVTKSRPLFLKLEYTADMVEDAIRWFERNKDKKEFDISILLPDQPQPKPEQKSAENCAIRYFHSRCPLNPEAEVDIYTCTNCEHYFHTASKSIICKKV